MHNTAIHSCQASYVHAQTYHTYRLHVVYYHITSIVYMFDGLNADAIHAASLHATGAASPSGLDAAAWRNLCCSFKSASATLWSALAAMGQRICTEAVHPIGLMLATLFLWSLVFVLLE